MNEKMADNAKAAPNNESELSGIEGTQVQTERILAVSDEVMRAVNEYILEIPSANQVPITKEWLQTIIESDATSLIAAKDENEKILGLAVLVVYHTLVNPRALIETPTVDSNARRLGIGTELVIKCIEEARKRKVNTVRLATGKQNDAANRLFKELGGELSEDYNWYDFSLSEGPK